MTQTPLPTARATDGGDRILDTALALMADRGAAGTSMRQLAAACGLNVATIYHYFPSKAFLLQCLFEKHPCGARLHHGEPALDASTAPRDRLVALIDWVWADAIQDQIVWRLVLGEALRKEDAAATEVGTVLDLLTARIEQWLHAGIPELADRAAAVSSVIRGHVLALMVEHLASGAVRASVAHRRAEELASVVVP